jgi:hypothetical protein
MISNKLKKNSYSFRKSKENIKRDIYMLSKAKNPHSYHMLRKEIENNIDISNLFYIRNLTDIIYDYFACYRDIHKDIIREIKVDYDFPIYSPNKNVYTCSFINFTCREKCVTCICSYVEGEKNYATGYDKLALCYDIFKIVLEYAFGIGICISYNDEY